MLRQTLVAFTATASLAVGAAALTPAMANYDFCYENPTSKGCPGNYDVANEAFHVASHIYKEARVYKEARGEH